MMYKIKVKSKYLTGINKMIIWVLNNDYHRPKDIFNILKIFYSNTLKIYIQNMLELNLLCIKKVNGIGGIYVNKNFDGEYFYLNIEDDSINLNSLDKKEKCKIIKNNLINKSTIKALSLKNISVCY
ncbi:hypothetical protein BRSU_0230 [Brachyspira suanatina]|uniref:Uncharacterized protein n=1 Tax=Brachyspira suanatina TaxID=381802 RepID=A0A0G4K4C3_9SPIR|nr:hypothetical protein [Brachyspira suanatina]CRF31566.1 hypothetical protein BRSU_0230 [Brachyspira suanatina]